jgi:hypothetical protein
MPYRANRIRKAMDAVFSSLGLMGFVVAGFKPAPANLLSGF